MTVNLKHQFEQIFVLLRAYYLFLFNNSITKYILLLILIWLHFYYLFFHYFIFTFYYILLIILQCETQNENYGLIRYLYLTDLFYGYKQIQQFLTFLNWFGFILIITINYFYFI